MKRRTFIKSATGVMALAGNGTMLELVGQSAGTGSLEKAFQNPPADAGLSVVYHWTGGVVTKEGITADMEGMAASGINTVNWFYFDGSGVQDGVQVYPCKSPEWWDLVNHLMSEAQRVGLTVAPHVCSSWGPSGTEGITPELSAQILVWSEAEAEGGRPFSGSLGKPARPRAGAPEWARVPLSPWERAELRVLLLPRAPLHKDRRAAGEAAVEARYSHTPTGRAANSG